jgi:hypothetical protein
MLELEAECSAFDYADWRINGRNQPSSTNKLATTQPLALRTTYHIASVTKPTAPGPDQMH